MNNNPRAPVFHTFHTVQHLNISVHMQLKINFQQRIAFLFGPAVLAQVLATPHPVIVPLLDYTHSFNVQIFILY